MIASPIYLSMVPLFSWMISGHGGEIAPEQGGQPFRVVLVALRQRGEGADVGEQHGQVAALAADLQRARAARQPVDHHRRQIAAEGVADGAPARLLAHVAGHGEPEQQHGQSGRDIDPVDQQLMVAERIPGGTEAAGDHERQQRRQIAGAQERPGPGEHQPENDQRQVLQLHDLDGPPQDRAGQQGVQQRDLDLDTGHGADDRRRP